MIVVVALGCPGSGVDAAPRFALIVTVPPLGTVAGALYTTGLYPHAVLWSLLNIKLMEGFVGLALNVPQSALPQLKIGRAHV